MSEEKVETSDAVGAKYIVLEPHDDNPFSSLIVRTVYAGNYGKFVRYTIKIGGFNYGFVYEVQPRASSEPAGMRSYRLSGVDKWLGDDFWAPEQQAASVAWCGWVPNKPENVTFDHSALAEKMPDPLAGFAEKEGTREKPPTGLLPRKLHDQVRVQDIMRAISDYLEAGKKVPAEWLVEIGDIVERLGDE